MDRTARSTFRLAHVADGNPRATAAAGELTSLRDQWPKRPQRAMASAGMAELSHRREEAVFASLRRRDGHATATPASGWERTRPKFFSLYRDRKYVASMAGLTHFEPQEVTIFNDRELAGAAEIQVLLPFYYRNSEVVLHAIGIDDAAQLEQAAPDKRPRIFFHGDSITQGHGVTSPRETYVWQVAEQLNCVGINFGFGGTAWADNIVAQTIASRNDWDVLSIMLGTNSFAGTDATGKPETAAQYAAKYDAFLTTIRARADQADSLRDAILNRADLDRGGNQTASAPSFTVKASPASYASGRQRCALALADGPTRSTTRSSYWSPTASTPTSRHAPHR